MERRLDFALAHRSEDFKYGLFTDENKWQIGGGVHKSWQKPKNRKKRKVKNKRHAKKINVWGGIKAI
jgi:hypothetical protein